MSEEHWSKQKEAGGGFWQFRLMLGIFRLLGPGFMAVLSRPVIFFFWLFSPGKRRYSREFLKRAGVRRPRSLRHFQSFGTSLVDKMAGWAGILELDDLEIDSGSGYRMLLEDLKAGRGVLALCSHLGNIEMLRALGSLKMTSGEIFPDLRILSIVEFNGTGKFNEMLENIDGSSMEGIIPVSEIGPDTMIRLQEFVESGGMVVIAGDRTSATNDSKWIDQDFLGKNARFPYGVYYLADLLGAPVYTIFSLRQNDVSLKSRYRYIVNRAPVESGRGRQGRDKRIASLSGFFVERLEALARSNPYQWYNFYPFWGTDSD